LLKCAVPPTRNGHDALADFPLRLLACKASGGGGAVSIVVITRLVQIGVPFEGDRPRMLSALEGDRSTLTDASTGLASEVDQHVRP
jgi:hypothetical protein